MSTPASHVFLLGGLLALALVGCGEKPKLERQGATKLSTSKEVAGSLQAGLRKAERGSPEAALYGFWRRMDQGVTQLAGEYYHPRVQKVLGVEAVQGGLREQRTFYTTYVPTTLSEETTKIGQLIAVTASGPKGRQLDVTYVLRRSAGEWRIVYDTALEDGLFAFGKRTAQYAGSAGKAADLRTDGIGAALAERFRLISTVRSAPVRRR